MSLIGLNQSHIKITMGYYLALVLVLVQSDFAKVTSGLGGSAGLQLRKRVQRWHLLSTLLCFTLLCSALLSTLLCLAPPWSPNRHQNRHYWWQAVALSLPPKPPLLDRSCRIAVATEMSLAPRLSSQKQHLLIRKRYVAKECGSGSFQRGFN